MVMLNVGILAIVTAFNSGAVALKHASEISSASVLADKQMELYRALKYTEIALDSTSVTTANTETPYQCDSANKLVTIVVRRASDLHVLARVSSSFDQSTGL